MKTAAIKNFGQRYSKAVFRLLHRPDRRHGHFSGHVRTRTRCTILKTALSKKGDSTHFNEKGARAMADLIMKELPTAEPKLQEYLKRP